MRVDQKNASQPKRARASRWIAVVLLALPVPVLLAWLLSGQSRFTSYGKLVDVTFKDIFGDPHTEKQFAPGPIGGYYVGLDLVLGAVLIALLGAAILVFTTWLVRRRARRQGHTHGQPLQQA